MIAQLVVGVPLGYVLFTRPQTRRVTADLLRATADALAPAKEKKGDEFIQNRISEILQSNT